MSTSCKNSPSAGPGCEAQIELHNPAGLNSSPQNIVLARGTPSPDPHPDLILSLISFPPSLSRNRILPCCPNLLLTRRPSKGRRRAARRIPGAGGGARWISTATPSPPAPKDGHPTTAGSTWAPHVPPDHSSGGGARDLTRAGGGA
jgi:hypothetical protein